MKRTNFSTLSIMAFVSGIKLGGNCGDIGRSVLLPVKSSAGKR